MSNNFYIVTVFDAEFETDLVTICRDNIELSTLLSNLNSKRYKVKGDIILVEGEFEADYSIFCKPFISGLELGKQD